MSSGRSAFGPGGGSGGGRCGGRCGGCGHGRGSNWSADALEDPLPRRPGLHFHRALALPLGDRTRRTIANVVMSISFPYSCYLT